MNYNPESMRESGPMPLDQADGLRRMFGHSRMRFVPVVSNPNMAFAGAMLERLCTALNELNLRVLVIDASERAPAPGELAVLDIAECIEPLCEQVSYLAARGLPLRFVDTHGGTGALLQAVAESAADFEVALVHASASELCRLFARRAVRPLLLADDRPDSVTHAYAAMKLMSSRAGFMVYELLLGAADSSPRAERIVERLASCADDFLGAVLRDYAQVDPASDANDAPPDDLRRLVRELLAVAVSAVPDDGDASIHGALHGATTGPGSPALAVHPRPYLAGASQAL
ncbi:hypothetical protein BH09PSE5_BH09PSE5_49120 [soil metagenome]